MKALEGKLASYLCGCTISWDVSRRFDRCPVSSCRHRQPLLLLFRVALFFSSALIFRCVCFVGALPLVEEQGTLFSNTTGLFTLLSFGAVNGNIYIFLGKQFRTPKMVLCPCRCAYPDFQLLNEVLHLSKYWMEFAIRNVSSRRVNEMCAKYGGLYLIENCVFINSHDV